MRTRLLLILFLVGSSYANKPDVKCMVIHLEYVNCSWNALNVNYTFYSKFHHESFRECDNYIVESGLNVGCKQPGDGLWMKRFNTFYTKLQHGDQDYLQELNLKTKVKLNPPTNLTVQFGSDFNLWFKWNQIYSRCVESEIRYRVNNNKWEESMLSSGIQEYCINLPSNSSRYELQVRSRLCDSCGSSEEWSDWSEPAVWGLYINTDSNGVDVLTVVLYSVGGAILLLLILMLLYHERIRIILIPVVPKPSLVAHDLEEWLNSSKDLKKVFKTNYIERTCSVREYCPVSPSDSESSDSSIISVSTDQTICYNPVLSPDSDDLGPSSNAGCVPSEEQHISV